MSKIRVMVAEDHAILRAGLRVLLEQETDLDVIGEARCWRTTACELARLTPDVVTVGLSMPGGEPFEQLRLLGRLSPASKLLVLTMFDQPSYFRNAIAAGVHGYLLKRSTDRELIAAIRSVHAGSLVTVGALEQSSIPEPALEATHHTEHPELSRRERQVLRQVARGMTNREIAEQLFLSVKTVESYRARLMTKLGFTSRSELVQYAIDSGQMTGHTMTSR